MTYTIDNITRESLNDFQRFNVDTQLAILWYGYLDIKDQLDPAKSGPSAPVSGPSPSHSAFALVDDLTKLSPEQQLQAQRDIVSCKDTPVSRTYSTLVPTAKLEVWLLLARAIEDGTLIQVPTDYQLPAETNNFVNKIKQLDFEQRINFMRSAVVEMGVSPQSSN